MTPIERKVVDLKPEMRVLYRGVWRVVKSNRQSSDQRFKDMFFVRLQPMYDQPSMFFRQMNLLMDTADSPNKRVAVEV